MSNSNTDIYSYINKYWGKSVRLFFPHESRCDLKAIITIIIIIIIKREPSLHPILFFYLFRISLFLLSLSLSLSGFLLSFFFSLVFKDACKRTLLSREGKWGTTLNYMSKGCLRACDSARDTSDDDVVVVFVRHHT
jgi:hypothetical protein